MLIKCPECELQVSDKAISCPHCGFPFKPEKISRSSRKSNKRRRLPNGFGQIVEIKNQNLREPFRAMVTVGKNENGRPICKILKPKGYFATYNDAYEALLEYNKDPYELKPSITMQELFERWKAEYIKNYTYRGSENHANSTWAYCDPAFKRMEVRSVRVTHIKNCIENSRRENKDGTYKESTANMKHVMKNVFNLMFDYAVTYDLTDKNYSRMFTLSRSYAIKRDQERSGHMAFKDEEMKKLWDSLYKLPYVDIVLIQCYTGLRPGELGLIKMENVFLDKNYMIGGVKTKAGKSRIIPIHSKIKELVVSRYNEALSLNSDYVFNCIDAVKGKYNLSYQRYEKRFHNIMNVLDISDEHKPHDCRKQFITMAKKYRMDEYAIKRIVGHQITDVTENVYTERNVSWLLEEIEKIK